MKHTPAQIKKLNALLKRLKARHKNLEAPGCDPTTQLIMAFLHADASRKKAEQAYDALMEDMVDNNELRVSHTDEIIEVIGEKYLRAHWRIERMRLSLNEVYMREHDIRMHSVAAKPKKEQRQYLDSLPGITPYVSASVMLMCFGGHAIPVDDKLVYLLEREEIIDEGLTPAAVEALLLRQIKTGEPSLTAHLLLQAWSDGCKTPAAVLEAPQSYDDVVDTVREDMKRAVVEPKPKPKTTKKPAAQKTTKTTKKPATTTTKNTTKNTTKKTVKKTTPRLKKK